MTSWECIHCQAVNNDEGKPLQTCGACGRRWDDMPESEFDAWIRNQIPPRNEPGGPIYPDAAPPFKDCEL